MKALRKLIEHRIHPVNDTLSIGVLDDPGHGGACYSYMVESGDFPQMVSIKFQNGTIPENGVNGVTHIALLEVKDGAKVPSARRLTADQLEWHANWRGGTLAVVDGPEAALRVLGVMSA
jgi:hypothetical protein